MTSPGRPLASCRVLVTRPEERAPELVRRLRALGASVEARPTIALVPPRDAAPARRAVASIDGFDWVVFTSANGVRFFAALHRELHGEGATLRARVAAIGPATALAASRAGWEPAVVAVDSRSEGLAAALREGLSPGERVLVVRPEVARPVLPDMLRELGARPEAVVFYRNVPSPEVDEVGRALSDGRYDVAVLSSPSSLERLLESGAPGRNALLEALAATKIVAIGPVTARAVERCGLRPAAVSDEPTDDAVVEAVLGLDG